jgi:hypothetical protein
MTPVSETFGALLLGAFFAILFVFNFISAHIIRTDRLHLITYHSLSGTVFVMCYIYFRNYPRDSPRTKALVRSAVAVGHPINSRNFGRTQGRHYLVRRLITHSLSLGRLTYPCHSLGRLIAFTLALLSHHCGNISSQITGNKRRSTISQRE